MGTATDMKRTADGIVGSYDTRVSALRNLKSGVHETLNDFATNREESSREQATTLAGFANGLARKVGRMLRDFQNEHAEITTELTENLRQFDSGIENGVSDLLKGFAQAHDRMSRRLHGDLNSYASGVARETHKLLGGFRREQGQASADVKAAHAAWRDLTKTMAARRNGKQTAPEAGRHTHPRHKAKR
jgi:Sec-independent protein translocase protein TatA